MLAFMDSSTSENFPAASRSLIMAEEFVAAITQHIPEKSFQTCTELVEVWFVTMAGTQTTGNTADTETPWSLDTDAFQRPSRHKNLPKTMNWFMNFSMTCSRSTHRQMVVQVTMNPVLRQIKPFLIPLTGRRDGLTLLIPIFMRTCLHGDKAFCQLFVKIAECAVHYPSSS